MINKEKITIIGMILIVILSLISINAQFYYVNANSLTKAENLTNAPLTKFSLVNDNNDMFDTADPPIPFNISHLPAKLSLILSNILDDTIFINVQNINTVDYVFVSLDHNFIYHILNTLPNHKNLSSITKKIQKILFNTDSTYDAPILPFFFIIYPNSDVFSLAYENYSTIFHYSLIRSDHIFSNFLFKVNFYLIRSAYDSQQFN